MRMLLLLSPYLNLTEPAPSLDLTEPTDSVDATMLKLASVLVAFALPEPSIHLM